MVHDPLDDQERELRTFRPAGERELLERILGRLARQSAADPILRAQWSAPLGLLRQAGAAFSPELRVEVHEATAGTLHIVLTAEEEEGLTPEITAVVRRARQDAAFATALLKSPRTVLDAELPTRLPPGLVVHVHQNTVARLHVVLPAAETTSDELSDEELDRVAGGLTKPPPQP